MANPPRALRGRVVIKFPANVVAGDGMIITKDGQTYTFSSTGGGGGGGGLPEAPNDGKQYGRQSQTWTEVVHTGDGGGTGTGDGPFVLRAGDTMTGALQMKMTSPLISFNKQANSQPNRLQGLYQDKLRWQLSLGDVDPESTGNQGSNFRLQCYDDTGSQIVGIPLYIRRDTGKVTIGGPVSAPPGTPLLAINKIVSTLSCSIRGEMQGNPRWQMSLGDQDVEGTGEAGSNFRLQCYNSQSGNIISVPISIARATGRINFNGSAALGTGTPIVVLNKQDPIVSAAIQSQLNGAPRWMLSLGDISGQDNFRLTGYDDAGVITCIPLYIERLTGRVTIIAQTEQGKPMLVLDRIASDTGGPPQPNSNIGGSRNGVMRWHISLGDTDPEFGDFGGPGGAGGSNFRIHSYDDQGVGHGPGLYILRDSLDLYAFNTAYKPGGGEWSATGSDTRIKTVLDTYDTGLAAIKELNPKIYVFKGNDVPHRDPPVGTTPPGEPNPESPHYKAAVDGTQFVGLIGQEVEPIMPEMIEEREADIDGTYVTDYKGLNHNYLIYALINSVKELAARVEYLEEALGSTRTAGGLSRGQKVNKGGLMGAIVRPKATG